MQPFRYTILVLICCLVAPAAAQVHPGQRYVERNECEGEGCATLFRAVALRTVAVSVHEGRPLPLAFTIHRGDTITIDRINIHHRRVGAVRVRSQVVPEYVENGIADTIAAGDTVALLSYNGEGTYRIWRRGAVRTAYAFWDDEHNLSERHPDAPGVVIDPGERVKWYRVRDSRGRRGWISTFVGVQGIEPGE